MNEESAEGNEIIRVFIVDEDGNEVKVDPNYANSSCIKLEITNTEDENFGLEDSEYGGNSNHALSPEDSLQLENIKVEVLDNPATELSDFDEHEDEDESNDTDDSTSENKTKRRRNNFKTHTKGGKPITLHSCNICGYTSHQKSHYRRHLNVHLKPEQLECSICRKPMVARVELTEHMDEHRCPKDRSRFKCHLCSYTSNKLTNVSQHTLVHYKVKKEPLHCERCNFTTNNARKYKKHATSHLNEKKTAKCPICLMVFKSMALRREHIQRYKSPDDPNRYQCPECFYTTFLFNNFKEHMIIHRSEFELEMFQCTECPFKSKRKSELKRHIIVNHKTDDEVTPFQCEFCSYTSRRGNHLTSHMKNIHSREIVMKSCNICSYKSVSNALMLKHVAIHSMNERSFLCFVCGYKFTSQSLLDKHNAKYHVNDDGSEPDETREEKLEPEEEDPLSYSYELVEFK